MSDRLSRAMRWCREHRYIRYTWEWHQTWIRFHWLGYLTPWLPLFPSIKVTARFVEKP